MHKKNKKKIALIFQSEKSYESKAKQYLLGKGYDCICAESELEALSLLAYKKIDIVVSSQKLCTKNSRQPVVIYKTKDDKPKNQIALKLVA